MAPTFYVGQEVLATWDYGSRRPPEAMIVHKVGRVYVYAGASGSSPAIWRRFEIATGAESIPGGYSGGALYTREAWAEHEQVERLWAELRALGFARPYGSTPFARATSAQLRAVVDILKEV